MQELISRHRFFVFFVIWLIVFFPSWYSLSFTKVKELQRMAFASREEQLETLHPAGEMKQLLEMKSAVSELPLKEKIAILAAVPDARLPLATDRSMQRAILFPLSVVAPEEAPEYDWLVVPGRFPESDEYTEGEKNSSCSEAVPEMYQGGVLCWHL